MVQQQIIQVATLTPSSTWPISSQKTKWGKLFWLVLTCKRKKKKDTVTEWFDKHLWEIENVTGGYGVDTFIPSIIETMQKSYSNDAWSHSRNFTGVTDSFHGAHQDSFLWDRITFHRERNNSIGKEGWIGNLPWQDSTRSILLFLTTNSLVNHTPLYKTWKMKRNPFSTFARGSKWQSGISRNAFSFPKCRLGRRNVRA